MVDLDAYFARIGYTGSRKPTLATLTSLHELHPAAIAFEALSAFTGEPVSLAPEALEAKLVRGGRGGWCFEQNLLFSHVLIALGFDVKRMTARVRWNVPLEVQTARSHCLMQVTIEGVPYIADVGFGGLTLTAPLRFAPGYEQTTPHEMHRIEGEGGLYTLQAHVEGEWQTLYTFDLAQALVADYEVSNWYLCNFPQSMFVNNVVAGRAMRGVRHALRNTRYTMYRSGGTERRFIASVAEFIDVLEGPFGIRVPRSKALEEKLAAVIAAHPPA